jgi:AcrR family transcriptional regulator
MNTKEQILELADKLIRTKGYNSFSYKDISTLLNIKNAAIHYHFPSKEDLGSEVIKSIRIRFIKKQTEWKELNEKEQLNLFVKTYNAKYLKKELCIVGAISPSIESIPIKMQIEIKDLINYLREWLSELLSKGLEKSIFKFNEFPIDKADLILTQLMTSLIMSRIIDDKYFLKIKKQINEMV